MPKQLLRNFFKIPISDARFIAATTRFCTCPECEGAGKVSEIVTHYCDCEYCEIEEEEETGDMIDCPQCGGSGEWIDPKVEKEAYRLLRRYRDIYAQKNAAAAAGESDA